MEDTTDLPPLHARQTTESGIIEFTSTATFGVQSASLTHFAHNATTRGVRVDWIEVNDMPIAAGATIEMGGTEVLLRGWRRKLLNAPTDAHSSAITRFDGSVGRIETKRVPRYVPQIDALRSVPRSLAGTASVVIRTILKLNSPEMVLTAQLETLEQDVPEVRGGFSVDVELDSDYTIKWGANRTAITGRGRTEIGSFTSQNVIDFVIEPVTVSRGDWEVTLHVLTPRPTTDERLAFDDNSDEQHEDRDDRNRLMTTGEQ